MDHFDGDQFLKNRAKNRSVLKKYKDLLNNIDSYAINIIENYNLIYSDLEKLNSKINDEINKNMSKINTIEYSYSLYQTHNNLYKENIVKINEQQTYIQQIIKNINEILTEIENSITSNSKNLKLKESKLRLQSYLDTFDSYQKMISQYYTKYFKAIQTIKQNLELFLSKIKESTLNYYSGLLNKDQINIETEIKSINNINKNKNKLNIIKKINKNITKLKNDFDKYIKTIKSLLSITNNNNNLTHFISIINSKILKIEDFYKNKIKNIENKYNDAAEKLITDFNQKIGEIINLIENFVQNHNIDNDIFQNLINIFSKLKINTNRHEKIRFKLIKILSKLSKQSVNSFSSKQLATDNTNNQLWKLFETEVNNNTENKNQTVIYGLSGDNKGNLLGNPSESVGARALHTGNQGNSLGNPPVPVETPNAQALHTESQGNLLGNPSESVDARALHTSNQGNSLGNSPVPVETQQDRNQKAGTGKNQRVATLVNSNGINNNKYFYNKNDLIVRDGNRVEKKSSSGKKTHKGKVVLNEVEKKMRIIYNQSFVKDDEINFKNKKNRIRKI